MMNIEESNQNDFSSNKSEQSIYLSMEPLPEKRIYKYLETGEEVYEEYVNTLIINNIFAN